MIFNKYIEYFFSLPSFVICLLFIFTVEQVVAREGYSSTDNADIFNSTEIRLTERQALVLAKAYAQHGQRNDAISLYQKLINAAHGQEIKNEAAFQLAGIYMLEEEFRKAISLYIQILNRQPNLPRVRLELARAYFLNQEYEDAQLQFELVKGSNLPPAVLEKIDIYLTLIRRKKDWNFDFSMALVPDSNINQASGGKEECIALGNILLCRPLEEEKKSIGFEIGGTFTNYLHFNRDLSLYNIIMVNALEYEQGTFDDYQFFIATGPRYTFENGEISIQPTFRKRWYAGNQYNEEYGVQLNTQTVLNRFILNNRVSYSKNIYNDSYIDSFLNGNTTIFNTQLRYIINDRTFIQAGVTYQKDNTKIKSYGSDGWRYGLGIYRVLPYGFSFFSELSLNDLKYHDSQLYITEDYHISENTRKDKIVQFFLYISSSMFEEFGITPSLQYIYTKSTSNIWTHEYSRQRLNLFFNYRF